MIIKGPFPASKKSLSSIFTVAKIKSSHSFGQAGLIWRSSIWIQQESYWNSTFFAVGLPASKTR